MTKRKSEKILLTGNQGYIGTVLTEILNKKGYNVVGLDTNYYIGVTKTPASAKPKQQISKDIRNASIEDFYEVDAVIHLAALSNDPLGEFNQNLTEKINFNASIQLAILAKKAGVKRFVYASSQSMFGISNTDEELDEDNSPKNPQTAYAKTKWEAELKLKELNAADFLFFCFRPSTVF